MKQNLFLNLPISWHKTLILGCVFAIVSTFGLYPQALMAQVPNLLIKATSATSDDNSTARSTAVDDLGNVYIAGAFTGTVTFGTTSLESDAGGSDIFLAKYNSAGTFQWAKRAGGTGYDYAFGITVSGSDVYITGLFNGTANFNTPSDTGSNEITSAGFGDIFLAKYNDAGTFQWAKRAGGTGDEFASGVAVSGSDVYITGYFRNTANFNNPSATGTNEFTSAGSSDIFLAKYNSAGTFQWAKRAGGTGGDVAYGVAVSGSDVYITGSFTGTANFNTPSATGTNEITWAGSDDIFLAKYSDAGTFQWAKRAGGIGSDIAYGIAVSGSDVYITGSFNGTANFNNPSAAGSNEITSAFMNQPDIFLAKYNDAGTFQWAKRAGGTDVDEAFGITVSGSDVYITGFFKGTANFNTPFNGSTNTITSATVFDYDIFLAKYNSAGIFQSAKRAGGTNDDYAYGVAVSGSDVYITGSFRDTANFNTPSATGSNELTTIATNGDAFIARYAPVPPCTTPTAYAVTGGGAYCTGGIGKEVGLSNSETGVTYQLKVGGVNTGSVVAGNTGNAITFGNQTAAGSYTVEATRTAGGCTAMMTDSVSITTGTPPPTNAIPTITASNYTPCGGTQVTLTATPPSGYTGAEYLWLKNGTPVASQTGGSGTYTVNAGTVAASNDYTLQMVYTGSTCLSAVSASATIVTNVPDAVITPSGPTTFCVGTPTTLNASTGTGYAYQWRRGSTIVQVGGTSYIPTASGNHTVIVKDAYNCSKTSALTSITINALPTANAGADVNLCKGSSVVIGAASISGNTYTWSPTTGLSNPYISNPTLATNASGTYTVSVTDGLKGCSKSDAMVVTSMSGPPTPSVSKTVSGSTITLTSTTSNALSVNWYSNGALLFSNMAANSSINVLASNPAKAYTVKSKGANGCLSNFSNAITAKIGDGKTGDVVVEIEEGIMQAYPNPTNGLLNVVINDAALTGGTLLLYNGLGQVVATKEVSFFGGKANTTLDLQHLATGVYSLSFENKVVKVVKE